MRCKVHRICEVYVVAKDGDKFYICEECGGMVMLKKKVKA